jgi:hypothetical protein
VYLTCRGSDGALWSARATVQQGRVGAAGNWTRLGVAAGAVGVVNGAPLFAAAGTDGVVRTRRLTTGWVTTPLHCTRAPALAAGCGSVYLACRGSSGALVWSRNAGAGFAPAVSAGGTIVGVPAVAVDRAGGATAYVQATSGTVVRKRLDPATGWTTLSGVTVRGVGAAQVRG